MATMDTVKNSTQPSVMDEALADTQRPGGDLSPFTLVVETLKRQGLPITPDNIRRAVIANARESNQAGPDLVGDQAGTLRNYGPPTDSGPGVGQSGSVANKVERGSRGSGRSSTTTPPVDRHDDGGTQTTSAPPTSAGDVGSAILFGVGPAALGYGLGRYFSRMPPEGGPAAQPPGSGEFVGNMPPGPTGRTIDINPDAIAAESRPMLSGGAPALPGTAAAATNAGAPSDMEIALQRAIAPAGPDPTLTDVRPYVSNPADVIGAGRGIPGVSDVDMTRAAVGDLTRNPAAERLNPPQTVPFRPRPGGAPRVPPPNTMQPSAADLATTVLRMFGGRR